MAGRDALLVAEPQFKGAVHATVNAALLEAAALAFPAAPCAFLAEAGHAGWVRRALAGVSAARAEEVAWLGLPGLPALRRVGRLRRGAAELRVWWRVLSEARRRGARAVLICSATRPGILLLKLLAPLLLPGTPVAVVLHQLNELEAERPGTPRRRPVRLETLLRLPGPRALRFLAPARAVHAELERRFPGLAARTVPLDLPYLWQAEAPAAPPLRPGELVFGLFGGARPGTIEPFCALARRVRERFPRARFVLLGHLKGAPPEAEACRDVEGMSAEPLPLEELRRRAEGVHYAVWTAPVEHYRMRLSAAFLDALSFVKPCVYLDNPHLARYAEELGDIGHPCADAEALYDTVAALLADPSPERYRRQCQSILAGRRRLSPEAVAPTLARWLAPARESDPRD
ncbi:MAG TPA: hypothetical protein VF150_01930 [Thermoanaerobaculia bacterium]